MASDSLTCAQHQRPLTTEPMELDNDDDDEVLFSAQLQWLSNVMHVKFTVQDVLTANTLRPIFQYFSTLVYRILVYLIPGPVVSALANRFGCRIVSIIGSIIAGVAFAVSQFSPNIDVLILTYGVMGGQLPMLLVIFYISAKFYHTCFVVLISR